MNKNEVEDLRAGDAELYGVITKINGGRRFTLAFMNHAAKHGEIHKSLARKVKVKVGDVVLCVPHYKRPEHCEIVHVYTRNQLQLLVEHDEINPYLLTMGAEEPSNDANITFYAVQSKSKEDDNLVLEDFENL